MKKNCFKYLGLCSFIVGLLSNAASADSDSRSSFGSSVSDALISRQTWIPALGSLMVIVSGEDQAISDWASTNTPIFGSGPNARQASDQLNDLGSINLLVSSVLLPVPYLESGWEFRSKQLLFTSASLESTYLTTNFIKNQTKKQRPDQSDRLSFPSGHTSRAAVQSSMSVENIKAMPFVDGSAQRVWQASAITTAALTGWARVEGQKHYPSDVLAGYALGNFFGELANNLLLHPGSQLSFSYLPNQSIGLQIEFQW